jgi:hypothetical protein
MSDAPQSRYRCRQVAQRLGVGVRTVHVRAAEIPGAAKVFGIWTFDPGQLEDWIADLEVRTRGHLADKDAA